MKLHELIDKTLLTEMYEQGYINLQVHPREPLGILNYSKQAGWENKWNDATMKCRGLVYDMLTMDVIARPFDKFFNYEQLSGTLTGLVHLEELAMEPVVVTDKQDGSLGILYPLPDGTWAVTTRGSFASDQALHATRIWNERYAGKVIMNPDITYLFEIIYPENRIVLNYGDMDDLVLLGGVMISDGTALTAVEAAFTLDWHGPVTKTFRAWTLAEALAMPPRENAEGIVVHFLKSNERVKIKQEDYVALHRLVTGLTDRSIWEAIGQGKTVEEIQEPLPEEFWPWVQEVADGLFEQCEQILLSVHDAYLNVLMDLELGFSRKDFADKIKDYPSPLKGYLFKSLDEQSIKDVVWKSIKPAAIRSLVDETED